MIIIMMFTSESTQPISSKHARYQNTRVFKQLKELGAFELVVVEGLAVEAVELEEALEAVLVLV
jgi:hypothetical protein